VGRRHAQNGQAGARRGCAQAGQRLDTLADSAPLPFRRQSGSDYAIPALTLLPDRAPKEQSFAIHFDQA
jgi:NAD(P)H dehydrogenase (quinone)